MANQTVPISAPYTERYPKGILAHLSWNAVFAGLTVAFALQFLFTLLGIAIGLGAIEPTEDVNPLRGIGTGAIIWWIVSMLISLFAGGYVAGHYSASLNTYTRAFHGFIMWSLFALFSFYIFTTSLGTVVGGVGAVISETLGMAGKGIEAVIPLAEEEMEEEGVTTDQIREEVEKLIEESGITATGEAMEEEGAEDKQDPDQVRSEISEAFMKFQATAEQVDREALVNILVERTEMSREEARQTVEEWEREMERFTAEAEAEIRRVADDVAEATSQAAYLSFFALLLGAVVSSLGAGAAPRREDVDEEEKQPE